MSCPPHSSPNLAKFVGIRRKVVNRPSKACHWNALEPFAIISIRREVNFHQKMLGSSREVCVPQALLEMS